jgi:hypothetical protein
MLITGSPAHSSPLTHPPVGPDYRHPSPLPIPITPPKSAARPTVSPTSPTTSRRPQSLAGSYPLSLLHSRMSHAHRPHSVPSAFTLTIGSLGVGKACPPELRCPTHENIPFDAKYYELYDEHSSSPQAGPSHSPWVGVVDVQQHYFASFGSPAKGKSPPAYPGYRISARGQLQLIVKNSTQALKVFLIPYDLRALEPGGRLLVRERSYLADTGREVLRYAVELQFLCVEAQPTIATRVRDSSTRRRMPRPPTPSSRPASPLPPSPSRAFYLARTIRVVFPSRRPESTDILRTERADEVVPTSKNRRPSSPHASVVDEWRQIKADWAGAELDRGRVLAPVPVRRDSREGRSRRGSMEDREISERLRRMAMET